MLSQLYPVLVPVLVTTERPRDQSLYEVHKSEDVVIVWLDNWHTWLASELEHYGNIKLPS